MLFGSTWVYCVLLCCLLFICGLFCLFACCWVMIGFGLFTVQVWKFGYVALLFYLFDIVWLVLYFVWYFGFVDGC